MTYSNDVYELAIKVLGDVTDPIPLTQASELAEAIQQAIYEWLYREEIKGGSHEPTP